MSGIFDQIINYSPPLIVSGTVNYKGTWNASTNNPTLNNPPATSTKGDYYVVSTAGTQFSISFAVGDWIISSGTAWEKVDLTDAVSSVFGRTGAVVGVSTDYSAVGITNTAIGASSPSTGAFTTVSATTPIAVASGGTGVSTSTGTTNVVLSNSPTIVTPVIAQINDASGNETLKLASIASAVNEVTIENAATGNAVHILATGGDASVGLHLAGKGASGYVNVQDSVDATKRIMFNAAGGTTNTRTMLSSTQTVDRTISLPDATDTLVGKATTDTLTNKTLTSPTLTTPVLGTPSSGTLSSCTGLPISTGVSGLGTGIATALAVNTGSAGAPVLFNGALGTPSSGTVTNLTGTASININGTVGATTAAAGSFTTLAASTHVQATGGGNDVSKLYASGTLSTLQLGSPTEAVGGLKHERTTGAISIFNGTQASQTNIAVFSSTGLAVTGALSSTTGANFATSSGNVGIATGSPNYLLTVKGTSSASTPIISVTDAVSSIGKHLKFGLDTSTGSGFGWLQYTHEGTAHEKIKINPSGGSVELCSGTTVASSTGLAVTGALSATGTTTIGANNTGSGLALLQLFGGSSANGGGSVYFGTNGTAYSSIGQASGILGGTSTDFVIYANNGSQNIKFYAGGSGNVGTFSSTGLAVTGGITQSGTGNGANTFTNTSASGYSSLRAINNAASECEFGIRGSTYSSYGALVASDGYIYRNGNFTLMADGSGVIKFAAGGATERARIDSGGTLVLQGNTWVPNVNNGVFWNYTGTQQEGIYYDGTAVVIRRANNDNAFRLSTSGLSVSGNLSVGGALSKGSGSFRIEHPLPSKSATHQLVHSFIEGPQADLIYRGKVVLIDGKASVNIDVAATMTEGTFEVLCRDVQCFTTNESGWTAVRGKVTGNILTIEAKDSDCTDEISWMVIGERKDPHMMETDWTDENGKVIVEPLKPVAQPIQNT